MDRRFITRIAVALLVGTATLALGACYESPDVTITAHQPGHYKGKVDPLVAKLQDPALQKKLRARLEEADSER